MKSKPYLLNRKRWDKLRIEVFKRDGYRCQTCGKAGALECDHVVPVFRGGDVWNPENLSTKCRDCHRLKTKKENTRKVDPLREKYLRLLQKKLSA